MGGKGLSGIGGRSRGHQGPARASQRGRNRGGAGGGQPPLHFLRRGGIAPPLFVHELSYPVLGYFKLLIYIYKLKVLLDHIYLIPCTRTKRF